MTTIVVLGDLSNEKRIELDGDPSTIKPNDVYKEMKMELGSSNSYYFCKLRPKVEGNNRILVAEVDASGKEDRSTKRKKDLSLTIDK